MIGTRPIMTVAVVVLAAAFLWLTPPAGELGGGAGPVRADGDETATPPPGDPADGGEPARVEPWSPPRPAAAAQRGADRREMVRRQIAEPRDPRDAVTDEAVLEAMRTVPRHVFVPEDLRRRAYHDTPLPIGHGQTISQPYIVAFMTQTLRLEPGDRVLEIGTGSGYQAAVLAQLTPNVFTIEIIEPLAERAGRVLREQGYGAIARQHGDGYYGWKEHAPFDAIIVTAAAGHVPPPLWEQLAPGGRMVIPVGGRYELQRLILLEKTVEGKRRTRSLMAVRFVPLTGDLGQRDAD